MAQFSVNAQRFDPYKNFKFRVKWDGRYVAGVSKVTMLKRTTEVVKHREGGDPSTSRKSPGRTEYDPITLERGVTHDAEFEKWAAAWSEQGGGSGPRDLDIEVFNEEGERLTSYKVRGCRVSSYLSMPYMDETNAVAIRLLKLDNDAWEEQPPSG